MVAVQGPKQMTSKSDAASLTVPRSLVQQHAAMNCCCSLVTLLGIWAVHEKCHKQKEADCMHVSLSGPWARTVLQTQQKYALSGTGSKSWILRQSKAVINMVRDAYLIGVESHK